MELPNNIKKDFVELSEKFYTEVLEILKADPEFFSGNNDLLDSEDYESLFEKFFKKDILANKGSYKLNRDVCYPGLCFLFNVIVERHGKLNLYLPATDSITHDLNTSKYMLKYFEGLEDHYDELKDGNYDSFWFEFDIDGIQKRIEIIKRIKDGITN